MTIHRPTEATIEQFAARLRAGGIVAFATETVYGLGADATNSDAVLKIYETKGRPRFNPLIVHCDGMKMAEALGEFSPTAHRLAEAFWPGPLTLVLPKREGAGLSDIVTAGLDTVGIRVPDHPVARMLISATGRPLAAPSANPSGRLSATTASQVDHAFGGRIDVLDGGDCSAGLESTILAVDGEKVLQLRAGALARSEIASLLQRSIATAPTDSPIAAPGMLSSHYAPSAHLRLDAASAGPDEVYLAFGPDAVGAGANLSPSGDLHEAARNLFSMLHKLDETADRIAVAPIPETGLGEAINDRLRRAAAPRN